MKTRLFLISLLGLLVLLSLACSSSAPTADPQATINAAVAATNAGPNAQATVDAAVAATSAVQVSLQTTVDASVRATQAAAPSPTPSAEYVTMTEEELAALVDQAVNEAIAATNQASTATTQATADDSVTQEEVDSITVYVSGAEEAIAYAESLLAAYEDLYGELAAEALDLLAEVEDDLEVMANNMAAINETLQAINTTLQQGLTLATETIAQLETAAQTASAHLAETQAQVQAWTVKAQSQREARAGMALNVQPNQIPGDAQAVLQTAFDFVDLVNSSLGDGRLSKDEMNAIAQLGANASAGLKNANRPQFQELSGKINEITGQLARGQIPQARSGLQGFERDLGSRPAPSRPKRP